MIHRLRLVKSGRGYKGFNPKYMLKAMRLLESTVWGGWHNVPPESKRRIEDAEREREKLVENMPKVEGVEPKFIKSKFI